MLATPTLTSTAGAPDMTANARAPAAARRTPRTSRAFAAEPIATWWRSSSAALQPRGARALHPRRERAILFGWFEVVVLRHEEALRIADERRTVVAQASTDSLGSASGDHGGCGQPSVECGCEQVDLLQLIEPLAQAGALGVGFELEIVVPLLHGLDRTGPGRGPAHPVNVRRAADDEEVGGVDHVATRIRNRYHGNVELGPETLADRGRDLMGVPVHRLVDDDCLHVGLLGDPSTVDRRGEPIRGVGPKVPTPGRGGVTRLHRASAGDPPRAPCARRV